jgi:isoleucyl-tRNA synthetase
LETGLKMPMTGIIRSRFWGIPLPIWRTEDKQEEILIGSVEEIIQRNRKVNSGRIQKKKPFDSKLEIWTKKTMI